MLGKIFRVFQKGCNFFLVSQKYELCLAKGIVSPNFSIQFFNKSIGTFCINPDLVFKAIKLIENLVKHYHENLYCVPEGLFRLGIRE
jgi:hypothetical protein